MNEKGLDIAAGMAAFQWFEVNHKTAPNIQPVILADGSLKGAVLSPEVLPETPAELEESQHEITNRRIEYEIDEETVFITAEGFIKKTGEWPQPLAANELEPYQHPLETKN